MSGGRPAGTSAGPGRQAARAVAVAPRLRLAVGRLARRLKDHAVGGLSLSQLSALATVERLGSARLGDLAAAERVSAPTMSRLVASLQEAGLLERASDPEDARATVLTLSRAGARRLDEVRESRTALLADRLSRLSPDDLARLEAALPVLESLVED
ncbi:MAG: MarR family winged helix-turn-helix transcriptional regulator [Motilibacteraceae bacterium]